MKQKKQIEEIVNLIYSEENKKQLAKEIKLQAHRVNQQMLRLERADKNKPEQEILKGSYAYNIAQATLAEKSFMASGSKKGKTAEGLKFEEYLPSLENKTVEELNEMKRQMDRFENSKTSGLRGIKKTRENKMKATLNYTKEKTGVDLSEDTYKEIMEVMQLTEISKLLNKKLGSPRKFTTIAKAANEIDNFEGIIQILEDANNYIIAQKEQGKQIKKPKVKTEEQANKLNKLFGNVKIFGVQDMAPDITEEEGNNGIIINAKFGGGII